jgi:hypothetical protein
MVRACYLCPVSCCLAIHTLESLVFASQALFRMKINFLRRLSYCDSLTSSSHAEISYTDLNIEEPGSAAVI